MTRLLLIFFALIFVVAGSLLVMNGESMVRL